MASSSSDPQGNLRSRIGESKYGALGFEGAVAKEAFDNIYDFLAGSHHSPSGGSPRALPPAEKVPLLPKLRIDRRSPTRTSLTSALSAPLIKAEHEVAHNHKIIFYDHHAVLSWTTAFSLGSSVFKTRAVRWMLLSMICTIALTTCFVALVVPDALLLDTRLFGDVLTFLKVFISFMLVIYITQSFLEWWRVVKTWSGYLISIRHLIYFLLAAQVEKETVKVARRLALAASYILNMEALNLQELSRDRTHARERTLSWLEHQAYLDREEVEQLEKVDEWMQSKTHLRTLVLTGTVWAWIGDMVAEAEGETGKLDPPMFARLLVQCKAPIDHIEEMKVALVAQVPYMYCQLLSCLVYMNNLLLAVSCGISLGSATVEVHDRAVAMKKAEDRGTFAHLSGQMYEALQMVGVSLIIGLAEPMLYIAFLQIGHLLCYPFGEERYHLATETMVARLQVDLALLLDGRSFSQRKRMKHRSSSDKKDDLEDEDSEGEGDEDGDDDDGEA